MTSPSHLAWAAILEAGIGDAIGDRGTWTMADSAFCIISSKCSQNDLTAPRPPVTFDTKFDETVMSGWASEGDPPTPTLFMQSTSGESQPNIGSRNVKELVKYYMVNLSKWWIKSQENLG